MSKSLDEMFDHPCRNVCSGWQQGYEKGLSDSVAVGLCPACGSSFYLKDFRVFYDQTLSEKVDSIRSLELMIKLWEKRNAEYVREIEVLKAKLKIAVDALAFISKGFGIALAIGSDGTPHVTRHPDPQEKAIAALKQITEVEGEK